MVKLSILFILFNGKGIKQLMKVSLIIIFGTIVTILGIIFHLQGQAVVGPQTSFMYANPEWIGYGLKIFGVGIVIIVIGIGLKLKKH